MWDDDDNHDDKIDRCKVTISNLKPGMTYGENCDGERHTSPTRLRLEYILTCSDGFGGFNCECSPCTVDSPQERENCNAESLCAEDGCGHGRCVEHITKYGFFKFLEVSHVYGNLVFTNITTALGWVLK